MLQAFRDKVMGWLGWIIIGLIILTFALFGLGSYLQDRNRVFAAKVNDVEISPAEVEQAYRRNRARLQEMMGEAFDPNLIDEKQLRKQALDTLINRRLLLDAARENGMRISDGLLAAHIHAAEAFQEEGQFSPEKYRRRLQAFGMSVARFEQETRADLLIDQLVRGIAGTVFVTPGEIDRVWALQEQTRDFEYLLVPAKPLEAGIEPDEAAIGQYYKEHQDLFMVPERVKLAYVRLRGEDLAGQVEVDPKELQRLYEERKAASQKQEQRRASHILVAVSSDADADTQAKAKARADALRARIQNGESFEDLAREHSEDPVSAAKGGDLGFFGRGDMVPAFEQSVYGLEPGQVSEPVRTQFGYHIIKLTDTRTGTLPPLEEMRPELERELAADRINDLFYDKLEQLTDLTYEQSDSLEAAAQELGLEIQYTDWVEADEGDGIASNPKLRAAAFSEDVLEEGNNSEPVEIGHNDVVVVRIAEREPEHLAPLDQVREKVVHRLVHKLATQAAREQGKKLAARMSEVASLSELNTDEAWMYRKAEGVKRSDAGYNDKVLRRLFTLPHPADDKPVDTDFALPNGDYALARLTGVKDGDPAAMKPEQREQLRRGLENLYRSLASDTLLHDLRARADIVIPERSE
ncbi:MAG TPA: hypothetical protein ENJ79_08045 [Gammaproteobacteria bacterium]|nr:hypothetical protein [Gammaproteobacteria bacterium]